MIHWETCGFVSYNSNPLLAHQDKEPPQKSIKGTLNLSLYLLLYGQPTPKCLWTFILGVCVHDVASETQPIWNSKVSWAYFMFIRIEVVSVLYFMEYGKEFLKIVYWKVNVLIKWSTMTRFRKANAESI